MVNGHSPHTNLKSILSEVMETTAPLNIGQNTSAVRLSLLGQCHHIKDIFNGKPDFAALPYKVGGPCDGDARSRAPHQNNSPCDSGAETLAHRFGRGPRDENRDGVEVFAAKKVHRLRNPFESFAGPSDKKIYNVLLTLKTSIFL